MSDGAISDVPLTSAGLSGSVGSAARRSQSTRSADCALAERCGVVASGAKMPKPNATNATPNRLVIMQVDLLHDIRLPRATLSLRSRASKHRLSDMQRRRL